MFVEHFPLVNGTLFLTEVCNVRDITGYTNYPSEHEVILPPGMRLGIVADAMEDSSGLRTVHLKELTVCTTIPT